jgi:hypothetical protein
MLGIDESQPTVEQGTIKVIKRPRTFDPKVLVYILRMIVIDLLPLDHIRSLGCRQLVRGLKGVDYIPPHKRWVRSLLAEWYELIRSMISAEMKGKPIALTHDCWSSDATKGYSGTTAHWIDEITDNGQPKWVMKQRCLGVRFLPPQHSAQRLMGCIEVFLSILLMFLSYMCGCNNRV